MRPLNASELEKHDHEALILSADQQTIAFKSPTANAKTPQVRVRDVYV